MSRSLLLLILLVATAGVVTLGVGVALTYGGVPDTGGQLIGAGSTILGSGIVGLFLARVSATISGQVQEGVEARREHKREIDDLVNHLLTEKSIAATRHEGMSFLEGYLAVRSPLLTNLEFTPPQKKEVLLWNDLVNHWPKTRRRAEEYLRRGRTQNKEVHSFIEDCDKSLKEKISLFWLKMGSSGGTSAPDQRAMNDWFIYAASKVSVCSSFIMGRQTTKPELSVDANDLTYMTLPTSLEAGALLVDVYEKSKPEEVPPELKEALELGKGGLKRRFSDKLVRFLTETINDTVNELSQSSRKSSLVNSKSELDLMADELLFSFNEVLMSKSVPGVCDYVRVG